jgi:hypothetical protein
MIVGRIYKVYVIINDEVAYFFYKTNKDPILEMKEHLSREYNRWECNHYNKTLYKLFDLYGVDNARVEILEEGEFFGMSSIQLRKMMYKHMIEGIIAIKKRIFEISFAWSHSSSLNRYMV